jgi:hypothetical protein
MLHHCEYLCSELITVTYEDQPGEIFQTMANLEEISAESAIVLLEQQPSIGSSISLSIQGRDLFGVIQGSLEDEALGWYVTVAFDAASLWNPRWLKPKHLVAIPECTPQDATGAKAKTLEHTSTAEENVPVNFD